MLCLAAVALGCNYNSNATWQAGYLDARLKFQQGYTLQALKLADECYQASERHNPIWSWRCRILKAQVFLRQGHADQAAELLAPDPPADLPLDVPVRRKVLQGQAFCLLNKPQEANAVWAQAEKLIPAAERSLRAELAFVQGLCQVFADPASARTNFSLAAELAHGIDPFTEASAVGGIGYLLLKAELYDEAIEKFNKVLQLTNSLLLRERALGNAAECYAALGDWRQSISFADQAEKLAEQIENAGEQERLLIDLGKAHFALWESSEAERNYLTALSIARQRHDQANTALCYHNLVFVALRRHDLAKADEYLKQGEALQVGRESLHFALDSAKIAAERKQFPEAERLFRDLLPRTGKDAVLRSVVQRDLGKVYWQENKNFQADQTFREGIATAERALTELKRPEDRMSFMDQTPFYDAYIQFLVAQSKPDAALKIAERSRAQVLTAALATSGKGRDPEISVPALQATARRQRQVILTYSMTDEATFLWVISASRFKLFDLPAHRELSAQIEAFNREIQDHRNLEDSRAGIKLYQSLIQPAEKLTPKGSSVVVIPSKLLSVVNFEALVVPAPQPHYWIEDVDVQVAGSLALLAAAQSRKPARNAKALLALGAPIEASKDFPALKFAPVEMQLVQNHFSAAERVIVSGKDATPQAYGSSNPGQFRFVHLDTHGVASDLNPLDSAIILSPGADNSYKLHAQQIKDIPLHADLVTISSCYGAGTRWYQGEGIVGLAWAFLRAGAHQVIAALWEVDDASSPQLMDDFYGELTQGKPAVEALHDAKLKMLHSADFHRHPYYWASLQLYTGY